MAEPMKRTRVEAKCFRAILLRPHRLAITCARVRAAKSVPRALVGTQRRCTGDATVVLNADARALHAVAVARTIGNFGGTHFGGAFISSPANRAVAGVRGRAALPMTRAVRWTARYIASQTTPQMFTVANTLHTTPMQTAGLTRLLRAVVAIIALVAATIGATAAAVSRTGVVAQGHV